MFCQYLLMIYINFSLGYTITKDVILMNELNIAVGARITELRKQRGYTREKLSELADVSVQFLADIEKGFNGHNYFKIANRSDAISTAIKMLNSNDCLLVLGKGGELYQDINGIKIPYNDFDEIKKILNIKTIIFIKK